MATYRGNVKNLADSVESMEQFCGVWRTFALNRRQDADVRDLPGLAVRWADRPFMIGNAVALTESGVDLGLLEKRLAQAVDIMRAKPYPGLLAVFDDLLDGDARDGLESAAVQAGLKRGGALVGMAGDVLAGLPEPAHPDLTFARVRTEEQLRAFGDLNARANGLSQQDAREGWSGRAWTEAHTYLGLLDGVPVSCAAALEEAGRLYLVCVATPDLRRRGYGEALSRKALYEGAQATGLTRATLHATDAGMPIYARIGFTANSPVSLYALVH